MVMTSRAFAALLVLVCGLFTPDARAAASYSYQYQGASTMSSEDPAGITVLIGALPQDWISCNADTECALVYVGCAPIAVNLAHAKAVEASIHSLGLQTASELCEIKIPFQSRSKCSPANAEVTHFRPNVCYVPLVLPSK
jgi:hypothetical protein